MSVTIATGAVVRLKGATRSYTGVITKSEPNRVWLRIGDDWDTCYEYIEGEWRGVPTRPGRQPPRTRIVGVLNRSEHNYTSRD